MKLYEVPRKSWIKVIPEGPILFFDHIDGMYSYCLDKYENKTGRVVHIAAWTEVEIIDKP